MVLGDGSLLRSSKESGIKFEQGYKQKEFLYHLFDLFSKYAFMEMGQAHGSTLTPQGRA